MPVSRILREDFARNRSLRRQRIFRDRLNPLDYLDDNQVHTKYRFSRQGILFLCDILEDKLRRPTNRSYALPVHLQVLTALSYFSSGSLHRVVADGRDLNLSQSSVTRVIQSFTSAVVDLKDSFIKFPTLAADIHYNQQLFFHDHRIPNVVGLIDGTHVQIIAPVENEDVYVNRCSYHSLNIQVICNYDCKIINVVAKWPGSVHDSTIMKESVKQYFENARHPTGILLGDSGYPCLNWLLTPYRRPSSVSQENFNK